MKKIVALVLSLVMVLGLATTAMAAPAPAYMADLSVGLDKPMEFNLDGVTGNETTVVTCTFKLEQQVAEISVNQTFAKYVVWAVSKETNAPAVVNYYTVAASAESADYAFVNGTEITYLVLNTGNTGWTKGNEVVKVPTVSEYADLKCGDMFIKGDYDVYADAAENLYVEHSTGSTYYAGGKLVKLLPLNYPTNYKFMTLDVAEDWTAQANILNVVTHEFKYDAKTVNGANVVTNVYCAACDKTFAFVQGTEAAAIAAFGAGNYDDSGLVVATKTVWVGDAVAAGTDAPAAGDKVESAETFDAGIAMYVGMSVMAAAGSAVVLKKKD